MTTGAPGPSRGGLRVLRAGAVAGTVLGLAAGAHVAAGGGVPAPALLAAVAVVLVAVCLLLAGRRFSWPVLGGLLGGGQVALHAVFACSGPTTAVVAAGHHQEWTPVDVTAAPGVFSVGMTFAHAVATVLAVLALVHGEFLLWSLWAWLRPLVRVLLPVLRHVAVRVAPVPADLPKPRSVAARRVRRRGPPRVPALATTS